MKSVTERILQTLESSFSWCDPNRASYIDDDLCFELAHNIIDQVKALKEFDLSMLDRLAEHAELIREGLTTRLNDIQGWEWVPIYESPFDPEHESDDYPYDEIPSERIRMIRIDTEPAIIIRIQANKDDMRGVHIEFTEEGGRLRASCGRGSFDKDKQANINKAVDHAIAFITGKLRIGAVEEEPCEYGDLACKQFDDPSSWVSWLVTWRPEDVIASPRVHGL